MKQLKLPPYPNLIAHTFNIFKILKGSPIVKALKTP